MCPKESISRIHSHIQRKKAKVINKLINCNPTSHWFSWNCLAVYWNDRSKNACTFSVWIASSWVPLYRKQGYQTEKFCHTCFMYSVTLGLTKYNLMADVSPGSSWKGWQSLRFMGHCRMMFWKCLIGKYKDTLPKHILLRGIWEPKILSITLSGCTLKRGGI